MDKSIQNFQRKISLFRLKRNLEKQISNKHVEVRITATRIYEIYPLDFKISHNLAFKMLFIKNSTNSIKIKND